MKGLTNIKGLQATGNVGFKLDTELVEMIASLDQKYLDDVYATELSLAKIDREVWLGKDADDNDMDILLGKDDTTLSKIEAFEIPDCENISSEKIQEVLKKLKGLEILIADKTHLDSLDFIGEGSKLRYISVLNTSLTKDTSLKNLEYCTNLEGLMILVEGLDLRQYSKIISDMCSRKEEGMGSLACGKGNFRGLITSDSVFNTLNGSSKDDINEALTCFGSYSSTQYSGYVDFTHTGLTSIMGSLYSKIHIKLPACFENFSPSECANATIDYTNLLSGNLYDCDDVRSENYGNFLGYREVHTGDALDINSIIGKHTNVLQIGKCSRQTFTSPKLTWNFSSIVSKAPNITDFAVYGALGLNDISVFSPLHLKSLSLNYSSIFGLESDLNKGFENMAESLTALTVANCSSFNNLNGLEKLGNIKTLDLSNDTLLENIQTIKESDGSIKNIPTCQYIVNSLPNLEELTLKGCKINDFSYLTKSGFKEISDGVFEKNKSN